MTRILVTGSRAWRDRRAVVDALDDLLDRSCGPLTVVHGAAAGADGMAHAWAVSHPGEALVIAEPHPADWRQHGKQAGFIRNGEMVALGADVCLAFIRENSPGASHCAALAEKAGIPVRRFTS